MTMYFHNLTAMLGNVFFFRYELVSETYFSIPPKNLMEKNEQFFTIMIIIQFPRDIPPHYAILGAALCQTCKKRSPIFALNLFFKQLVEEETGGVIGQPLSSPNHAIWRGIP